MPQKTKGFDTDAELRMIALVENRPILWGCTLDVYRRADLKGAVWDEVARALGPNFSEVEEEKLEGIRLIEEAERGGFQAYTKRPSSSDNEDSPNKISKTE